MRICITIKKYRMKNTPPIFKKYVPTLKKSKLLRAAYQLYHSIKSRDYFCLNAKVINHGFGSYSKKIVGKNNMILIGNNTRMINTKFHIIGNNNTIRIGNNCWIGQHCSFWMEGNNINIDIGDNTTFTLLCHFNAQEDNTHITVGKDCMFSNHVIVRTSDSHPIYSREKGERINPAKSVLIGNHVWVAPDSKIMKGAIVGDGCIVGSNTLVTKEISDNCLVVGMPAKVVRTNIEWTREDIIHCR